MALSNGKQGHCLLSKASRASLHCVTCVEDKDDEQRQGRDWKGYDCQPGRKMAAIVFKAVFKVDSC